MNQQEAQQLAQQVCDLVAAAGLFIALVGAALFVLAYGLSKLVAAFRAPVKLRKKGVTKKSSLQWLWSPVVAGLLLYVWSGYIGWAVATMVRRLVLWLPHLIAMTVLLGVLVVVLIRWRRARRAAAGVP